MQEGELSEGDTQIGESHTEMIIAVQNSLDTRIVPLQSALIRL